VEPVRRRRRRGRALGEAADLLGGEGDAVVGFAVLLPARLLEDAGGADEVAGLEVPLDVGLAGFVEDGCAPAIRRGRLCRGSRRRR